MLLRTLLVVEPPALTRRLERLLRGRGVLVSVESRPERLWRAISREGCDLLLATEEALAEPAAAVTAGLREMPDRPELIVLETGDEPSRRAELLAVGCWAVLSSELDDELLAKALDRLLQRRAEELLEAIRAREQGDYRLSDFASESEPMRELLRVARRVAEADSSVLILGETGVGKEWLARAMHAEGRRSRGPFVAVNLAALPDTLIESELFGHVRGAFTGAQQERRGCFEMAHQGTLFLDEIGDLPLHLQTRLLRVVQERRIQRLGAEKSLGVDVRIMAATHRDLDAAIETGAFRTDLYYRLGVVTLAIPPLRGRREDIPALATSYLQRFAAQLGRDVEKIATAAMEALVRYPWPGNVRELINVMERSVLLTDAAEIGLADLPRSVSGRAGSAAPGGAVAAGPTLPKGWLDRPLAEVTAEATREIERAYLASKLAETGGHVGRTARRAGLTSRSVYSKMRALGLRKEDFRKPPAT